MTTPAGFLHPSFMAGTTAQRPTTPWRKGRLYFDTDTNTLYRDTGAAWSTVASAGAHPDLATHDAMGLATDSELSTHVGASDPHTGYQKESEKDVNSGYAGLDANGVVPDARIASTIARDSEVSGAITTHEGAGDPHTGYLTESAHGGVSPTGHHAQSHALDSGDHTLSGKTAGQFVRATGAAAFAFEAVPISKGGTLLSPSAAINVIVWRAPFACTVTNVRGYRVGGTGATINARKNGSSNHMSSDLSLSSADTWMSDSGVQNTAYAVGDKLEIMVVSVAGSPTQVAIQVDFTRP